MTNVSHRTKLSEALRLTPLDVLDEVTVNQRVKASAFQGAQ